MLNDENKTRPEFAAETLLSTPIVTIRDVKCRGSCRHESGEELAAATELVFPYRGVYVRHVGHDQAVAEANQVLFFNSHGRLPGQPSCVGWRCQSVAGHR